MWELVKAGGWLMLPLVLCSIFTVAISLERFIRLKKSAILPKDLLLNPAQSVQMVLPKLKQNQDLQVNSLHVRRWKQQLLKKLVILKKISIF